MPRKNDNRPRKHSKEDREAIIVNPKTGKKRPHPANMKLARELARIRKGYESGDPTWTKLYQAYVELGFEFPDPNRHSARQDKFTSGRFIAWDGEGITPCDGCVKDADGDCTCNNKQNYCLLASSTGDYIWNDEGLGTAECLALILKVAKANPDGIHVGFSLDYDFNMILRDLPKKKLDELTRYKMVSYNKGPHQFVLQLLMGKKLWIRDRKTNFSVTLYDVFSFFQASFVATLKAWNIGTNEVVDRIEADKKKRGQFELEQKASIIEYCQMELSCLVELMDELRENMKVAGLRVSQWYGPGAMAQALYKEHKYDHFKRDMLKDCPEVNRAAQFAYRGGRFEQLQYGNFEGTVHVYDINSAYPAEIANLPPLNTAKWVHHVCEPGELPPVVPFSLYKCGFGQQVGTRDLLLPFPLWVRGKGDTMVNTINIGENWYWTPEYEDALIFDQTMKTSNTVCYEWYEFKGDLETKPFAWVVDLYEKRRLWKNKEFYNPAEKALKLAINSLYGKMCQQVGAKTDPKTGLLEPPRYHQLEWAGYVTAATRSKLWRAAMTNPSVVIGMETDGILCTGELQVDEGPLLGQWGHDVYEGITYVQCGVYWLKENGQWKAKYRGFDKECLDRDEILRTWKEGKKPYVTGVTTRFPSIRECLHKGDWDSYCKWIKADRQLAIVPMSPYKRSDWTSEIDDQVATLLENGTVDPALFDQLEGRSRMRQAAKGLVRVPLVDHIKWGRSKPYTLSWVDNDTGVRLTERGPTQDQYVQQYLREICEANGNLEMYYAMFPQTVPDSALGEY